MEEINIINTFKQINRLEGVIVKNIKDPFKISFWAHIKYHLYVKNINESVKPFKTASYLSVSFLLKSFFKSIIYFPKLFKSNKLIFVGGRKDENGKIMYTGKYITKKSFLIHYDQKDIYKNVFYLHIIKIFIYILSYFFAKIDIKRKKINWIKNKIINNTSLAFDEFMLIRKHYEFLIWSYFWRLFLKISRTEEIYFTSNNFFIPLIYVCDKYYPKIKCIEIAHALTHIYHPSYSYCFSSRKYILPHIYIENKYSFNSPVIFPSDLEFRKYNIAVKMKTNKSGFIFLVGQPNVTNFFQLFEMIKNLDQKNNINFRYIKHPLESEKEIPIKVINLKDIDFLNDEKHIVVGFSSNLLLEMYYEGHDVYSLDETYIQVFESRPENIPLISVSELKLLIN